MELWCSLYSYILVLIRERSKLIHSTLNFPH